MAVLRYLLAGICATFAVAAGPSGSSAFDQTGKWYSRLTCSSGGPQRAHLLIADQGGKLYGLLEIDWQARSGSAYREIPRLLLSIERSADRALKAGEVNILGWERNTGAATPTIEMKSNTGSGIFLTLQGQGFSCETAVLETTTFVGGPNQADLARVTADLTTKCLADRPSGTPTPRESKLLTEVQAAKSMCRPSAFRNLTKAGDMVNYAISGASCRASLMGVPLRTLSFVSGKNDCSNRGNGSASCSSEIYMRCQAADPKRQSLDCLNQNIRFDAAVDYAYDKNTCEWSIRKLELVPGSDRPING